VLELSRRWSPWTASLLLLAFCCFSPCGLYGQALVAGTVRHTSKGQVVGYIQNSWLGYLLIAGSVLSTLLILYVCLLSLVNRVVLRVEPGRLRLVHTPLPWFPGNLELTPADITRFEFLPGLRVKQGQKDIVAPTFILWVVDRAGRKHQLLSGIEEARCAWLEGEIRRTLGMSAPAASASPWEASGWEVESPPPVRFEPPSTRAEPPQERAPRSLSERLMRGLGAHALGYIASTQQVYAVGGHFGWFMLLVIGLGEGGAGGSMKEVGRALLNLYALLGGVDASGHGGKAELMEVWGKLSLIHYVVQQLLSRVFGARVPWGVMRKWAASTALACAGYGVAFALPSLLRGGGWGSSNGMLSVIPFFIGFTSVMTLWGLGFSRFMRYLQGAVRGDPTPHLGSAPRTNNDVGALLATGGAVLALGLAVGLLLPRRAMPVEAARTGAERSAPRTETEECRTASSCEPQCAQGNAAACNMLSELLEGGFGVAKDVERAGALATRACDLGSGIACMRVAAALERGAPSPEDLQRADALYRRSCELGNADGCAGVASLHEGVRNGPPRNPDTVTRFFTRACELGKREACEKLGQNASAR
jgi:hypothetical protein